MSLKGKNKAKVHKDLDGLDVSINQFGEVKINRSAEELNEFLNDNVDDKKLTDKKKKSK